VLSGVPMVSSVFANESMLAGCCLIIPVARPISVPRRHARDEPQLPTSLCVGSWTDCRNTHLETTPHKADPGDLISLRDNPVYCVAPAFDRPEEGEGLSLVSLAPLIPQIEFGRRDVPASSRTCHGR
jgi:hypothetical protein